MSLIISRGNVGLMMLTPWKAVLLPIASAAAFSLFGAIVGAGIGVIAPGYYLATVRNGDSPTFDPLQVGIGLGMTQGAIAGAIIGLVTVIVLVWREVRQHANSNATSMEWATPSISHWLGRISIGAGVLLLLIFCSGVTSIVSAGGAQGEIYRRWADSKIERIEAALSQEHFGHFTIERTSNQRVYLLGKANSGTELKELESKLTDAFGTEESKWIVRLVKVQNGDAER